MHHVSAPPGHGRHPDLEEHLASRTDLGGRVLARISAEHRGGYRILTSAGELDATATGTLLMSEGRPAVGDWVLARAGDAGALVDEVLPRHSKLSRKVTGDASKEQVLAANVDVVFIAVGLDAKFRARRIERFLTVAWAGGASPVVVLTKADLADDVEDARRRAESIALGVPLIATSVNTGEGIAEVAGHLLPDRTGALLGPSGTGKSSLINALLGEQRLAVSDVRSDHKGRHTTSHRELLVLPGGGVLIDTPGLRGIALWDGAEEGLDETFTDVVELFSRCRFNDCSHELEPGCAVQEALANAWLAPERWESYKKLQRELEWVRVRHDARLGAERRKKWKAIAKSMRSYEKGRGR